tara:strand:+ start:88 stop:876 length:789 start_codon:yes stop_codon:yes gene_type:complete
MKMSYLFPKVFIDMIRIIRAFLIYLFNIKLLSKNNHLRNSKFGEKVYVIANGPSLSSFDYNNIKNIDVIVMNNFDLCEWKDKVNIVAHCIGEPKNSEHWGNDQIEISKNTNAESYWYHYSVFKQIKNYNKIMDEKSYYFFAPLIPEDMFLFNDFNLCFPTLGYSTTAQMAIMVAIFMGYKEISLVGFDHDMLKNRNISPHFYKEGTHARVVDKTNESYLKIMTRCLKMWNRYYKIKRVSIAKNVEIINRTSNSYLDVFKISK